MNYPFDIQLERDALAAVIYNPELIDMLCYELKVGDFYFPPHLSIFLALQNFNNENVLPNINILLKHFGDKDAKAEINALLDICNQYAGPEMMSATISALKAVSQQRSYLMASEAGVKMFSGNPRPIKESSAQWVQQLRNIQCEYHEQSVKTLKDLLVKPYDDQEGSYLDHLQKRQELYRQGKEVFTGYKTGYLDIDAIFSGFNDGHLTLIGARTGVGKTTFMLNLALNQVFKNNIGVGIFTLEMPTISVAERLLLCHADLPWEKVRSGNLSGSEFQQLYQKTNELQEKTIMIDDKGRTDLGLLYSRALHWKDKYGIKMLFIDYLGLIKPTGKFISKYEATTFISQELKIMAKDLKIPIICLAQINRNPEKKEDKLPQISDLRDSGSLEQDADEIFLLHSPSQVDKLSKPGVLQVFLKKNRFGPTGNVDMHVNGSTGRISNIMSMADAKKIDEDRAFSPATFYDN